MGRDAGDRQPAVFKGTEYSFFRSAVSFLLTVGFIPLNAFVALVAVALFLLPARFTVAISALLLFSMVAPVSAKSKWGNKIARWVCKSVCGHFPITLHVEDINAFDPNQAYVFGCEPHSIFAIGFWALLSHAGFMPLTKVKYLGSSALLHLPLSRQILTWMGYVPVSRQSFTKCLATGYSCIIIPGGVRETIYLKKGKEVVFLKSRKGFVRIAIETGSPLVPVFCFGQSNHYNWWMPVGRKIAEVLVDAVMWAPIFFWGQLGLPIPFREPMHVVVGRPIVCKKNPKPTDQEVTEVLERFVTDLHELFDQYKAKLGYHDLQLEIK